MYGQGNGGGQVLAATTGVGTAAVLPATGMNSAISIAVAAAAGLAVWALVYAISTKVSKR